MTTLTDVQRKALDVLVDTFIPNLSANDVDQLLQITEGCADAPGKDAHAVLQRSGTSLGVSAALEALLCPATPEKGAGLNWEERASLLGVLGALSSRIGTSLLFGPRMPWGPAFVDLSLAEREAMLLQISKSPMTLQRKAFNDLKRLIFSIALSFVPAGETANPFSSVTGYTNLVEAPSEAAAPPWAEVDFSNHMAQLPTDGSALEVDVVVIGSGAGGGVAASVLTAAGYSVLVLEKGSYAPPETHNGREGEAFERLYEKAGLLTTSDGSIAILAGSTLGGGTTVNWACCIPPPPEVRKEWAGPPHNLPQFAPSANGEHASSTTGALPLVHPAVGANSPEAAATAAATVSSSSSSLSGSRGSRGSKPPSAFEKSLAAVWARIGASDEHVNPNVNNTILAQGSALLGYPCALTAQNFKDPNAASCGWSCFGDRSGNKQGSMVTFLADAARSGKCQFLDNCQAERILFDNEEATTSTATSWSGQGTAKGAAKGAAKGGNARPQATGVVARLPRQNARKGSSGNGAPTTTATSSSSEADYVRVHVKAKRAVILSAGSLHSPCVLLRSGLGSANKHVGKHLRLHPVTAAIAKFEHRDVRIYSGAPMTTVCSVGIAGPLNDGYGARLEVPSVHPGLMAACLPWRGGYHAKSQLADLNCAAAVIALQRDVGEGTVTLANHGLRYRFLPFASPLAPPLVHYSLDPRDATSLLRSVGSALRILAASGATYLTTLHAGAFGLERFAQNSCSDRAVAGAAETGAAETGAAETGAAGASAAATTAAAPPSPISTEAVNELAAASVAVGLPRHGVGLFSAHQMGTCRMGSDPLESVVDCDGESWDVDDLYVMDASVFPTASGANPMTTTLAIAHLLATRLATRLNAQDHATAAGGANKTTNTDDDDVEAAAVLETARSQRRDAAVKAQTAARQREAVSKWALRAVVMASVVAVARAIHQRRK